VALDWTGCDNVFIYRTTGNEMANILYGVHGIGHGHAIRALTIARSFPQHNFLFISDSDGYEILRSEYNVLKLPVNGSPAFGHVMPYSGAISSYYKNLLAGKEGMAKVMLGVERFQPDLAITDYEPNLPTICRKIGLSCLSLDHQHIARFGALDLPLAKIVDLALLRIAIWMQFRDIQNHMIISFFDPVITSKRQVKVFPPILRSKVIDRVATEGDHILAYHGYSTTQKFHKFLLSLPYPVRCYGVNENRVDGNVTYRVNSTDHFLDDLASCRYVMSTAGHTLLSEAFYFGKPVMAFPIRNACEQFINGYYLEKKGYGLMNDAFHPSTDILDIFERNRAVYKKNIQNDSFCGNETVMTVLNRYFNTKEYCV
jgi:uncharacterized protein (TIGR00661 family)